MNKITIQQIIKANNELMTGKERVLPPYIASLSQSDINSFFQKAFKKMSGK